MPAYKDNNTGKWYISCWYGDWTGKRKKKIKRGFETKREALEWEREFQLQDSSNPEMTFESFIGLYKQDVLPKLKENSWLTKENIITKHLMPYFGKFRICDITAKNVIDWQNEMRKAINKDGANYSPTYLKTIHNQLSSIFNHAIRFYGLKSNPAFVAGNMGSSRHAEMKFWTKEEYLKFADVMMDKPIYYYAFEILYWCGIREGELLALTPSDFNSEKKTLRIDESYQRLKGRDVITCPKTKKSNRVINVPDFVCEEICDYLKMLYGVSDNDRIFSVLSKSSLNKTLKNGAKKAGVKQIRVHDLRHSHVSLLIDMGFSALAIGERLGHETAEITLTYAHLFPSRQLEMAEKLNEIRKDDSNVS